MDLRVMLAGVRERKYGHTAGREQPAQTHLNAVRNELKRLVPPGMRIRVSGSAQSLPVIPWIAILDTNVTTKATEGLYVVYLYRSDLTRVYLSMNQGTTQHRLNAEEHGHKGVRAESEALAELEHESMTIRAHLSDAAMDGMLPQIDLGASGFLPRGYELGNIAGIEYDLAQLPDDAALRADLTRMIALYGSCVEINNELLATDPGRLRTTAAARTTRRMISPKPPLFRPKDSTVYRVEVRAHTQDKSRRHEALLIEFVEWMNGCGFLAANNVHPRDLIVDAEGQHWLIEAKTVKANAEQAVREAIGQLFSYRHFWYRELGQADPGLVALFSEPVGAAFLPLMNSLGIECIWRDGGRWDGKAPDVTTSLLKIAQANQP